MHNCIFNAHCIEIYCDRSCPKVTETSYLLERNGLSFDNPIFKESKIPLTGTLKVLEKCNGKVGTVVAKHGITTGEYADMITYCAICENWRGSQLHCTVYNLKYSKYLSELKSSWTTGSESDNFQFMKIWSASAKVLIVSNFDYVNFGNIESQTLLELLQDRQDRHLTTVIVTPKLSNLVSAKGSPFFKHLKDKLNEGVKVVTEI